MKKSRVTQELINIFPSWSKVRIDDQSVGFQVFNVFAQPLDEIDHELEKMRHNQYLVTANIDEPDIISKVELPKSFVFAVNESDPSHLVYTPPTVSGLVINELMSGYIDVSIAIDNDIKSFWYEVVPDRISLAETIAAPSWELLTRDSEDFPYSGVLEHHLTSMNMGGRLWVETTGGIQYLNQDTETGELNRAELVLTGITRKGTEETESLIFAWDEKRPTLKEWRRITGIDAFNFEDDVSISVRSADFSQPPYLSFYNLRYSPNRKKIDEFWQLNPISSSRSSLSLVEYITDDWEQLVLGFSDKEIKEEWELLDTNFNTFSGVDIAIQPFTERAWIVSQDGRLFCYELGQETASGIQLLRPRTSGNEVQIDCDTRHILLGEDIIFTPWHARPIREIQKYRVWYQDPAGNKYGILDGSPVSYSSDFWIYPVVVKRDISDEIVITTTMRGEYLLVLETVFENDDITQVDRVLVSVQSRRPLAEIDISTTVSGVITGIDFDSDQKMWINTTDTCYKLNLHSDRMLIDYDNKIIYLHESYDDVIV